jgi:hypothetical protein
VSYKLKHHYSNSELEIEEDIDITVYSDEFIILCNNKKLEQSMATFLEYLDVELCTLDKYKLKYILQHEFKLN